MDIRNEAYELYKIDWEHEHGISGKRKQEVYRDYASVELQNATPGEEGYYGSFERYLEDVGYGGELYACYNEFLECEYMDLDYMHYLLGDTALIDAYHFDRMKSAMEIAGWQLKETDGECTVWHFKPEEQTFSGNQLSNDDSVHKFCLVKFTYKELQEYLEDVVVTNPEEEKKFNQLVYSKETDSLKQIEDAFTRLADIAAEEIERNKTEWGSWIGHVVSNERPQDYIEIDITGYKGIHEVWYSLTVVQDNKEVCAFTVSRPVDLSLPGNVSNSKSVAWKELKEQLQKMRHVNPNHTFTLYSSDTEHKIKEHYDKLQSLGYSPMPEPINISRSVARRGR